MSDGSTKIAHSSLLTYGRHTTDTHDRHAPDTPYVAHNCGYKEFEHGSGLF